VKAPVPGPSSSTCSAFSSEEARTIAFARKGEEGQIAPTEPGERIMALIKCNDTPLNLQAPIRRRNTKNDFPLESRR
jgi:hypothetical protein